MASLTCLLIVAIACVALARGERGLVDAPLRTQVAERPRHRPSSWLHLKVHKLAALEREHDDGCGIARLRAVQL